MKEITSNKFLKTITVAIIALFTINSFITIIQRHKKIPLVHAQPNSADTIFEKYLHTRKTSIHFLINPDLRKSVTISEQPIVAGYAAIIGDINSNTIYYEKRIDQKMPIASLTKIMTALVALEHGHPKDNVLISTQAASIGENTMGLDAGEVYSLDELLYGLILNSGNDAAYAIAESVAGDIETFVEWMNIKARELGLTDTSFADPSGLDDNNMSTAKDLYILTSYAMRNTEFRKYTKTVDHYIKSSETHKDVLLQNQTNLLTTYAGVAGVKTGYTEAAGLCLVTYANNKGIELVGVVLNSVDRKGDMVLMLDHAYNHLGIYIEHNLLSPI